MLHPYNKGIAFIRYMYAHNLKIGKPTNLKDLAASKSKSLNRIAKFTKVTFATWRVILDYFRTLNFKARHCMVGDTIGDK